MTNAWENMRGMLNTGLPGQAVREAIGYPACAGGVPGTDSITVQLLESWFG